MTFVIFPTFIAQYVQNFSTQVYVCSRKQHSNDFHVIFLDFLLALKKYNSIKIDFGYYNSRNYVGKEKFKAPFIVDVSFPYSNILNDIAPSDFERLAVREFYFQEILTP